MKRRSHSVLFWKQRCIQDTSSDDINVPPNVHLGPRSSGAKSSSASYFPVDSETEEELFSLSGTMTTTWATPRRSQRPIETGLKSPPQQDSPGISVASPVPARFIASPTTSSPVLLETPPSRASRPPSRSRPVVCSVLDNRSSSRQDRRTPRLGHRTQAARAQAEPYCRRRVSPPRHHEHSTITSCGLMRTSPDPTSRLRSPSSRPRREFIPARWPSRVAHLRDQYNPLGIVFPHVPHFGSCGCRSACRVGTCTNSLMHLYCNINCCPYLGHCGNGLVESAKVFLARNVRTRALGVVAAETIGVGEILGQYLGELEHVSLGRAKLYLRLIPVLEINVFT